MPSVIGRWPIALTALLLAACTVCDATPMPEAPTPAPCPTAAAPPNKLGVHLLLDDGRDAWPVDVWPAHVAYARQAAGEWGYVTQLVWMDDLDPAHWQLFMDLCAEHHLTPIVRLATVYDRKADWWVEPPRDSDGTYRTIASRYADFIAALRWPTDVHYVVVGNEPNHGVEWGGRPDPAAYARFLIDVANALHAADANAHVLNAGFDPYAGPALPGKPPVFPGESPSQAGHPHHSYVRDMGQFPEGKDGQQISSPKQPGPSP